MKAKYHYEYGVFTDNLCNGRMFLGRFRWRLLAQSFKQQSEQRYGCCTIKKIRVYN